MMTIEMFDSLMSIQESGLFHALFSTSPNVVVPEVMKSREVLRAEVIHHVMSTYVHMSSIYRILNTNIASSRGKDGAFGI